MGRIQETPRRRIPGPGFRDPRFRADSGLDWGVCGVLGTMDFTFLDELLRRNARASGPDARAVTTGRLLLAVILLGAVTGFAMSLYGLRWGTQYGLFHVFAVMVKVPALLLLTLVVTCPSLYVFSALARTALSFRETVRLLLAASALSCLVLASLAPITAFFTFGTRSHPFLQLLNATFFTVAGLIALRYVVREIAERAPTDVPLDAPRKLVPGRPSDRVVLAWTVLYALVGAQMAWMMRPFVGSPRLPQTLFRDPESNVFAGLVEALKYLD